MAQYKVPQDVEADDKILGPFSPRQVVYLLVGFACIGFCILLFSFSTIAGAISAVPLIPGGLLFTVLALPLRKEQSTEAYFSAFIDFHFRKPNKRFWNPGQRNSTILITAPKKVEGPKTRDLKSDEASRRLTFLADIVDSEGRSVRGDWSPTIKEEYVTEAATAPDMFESYSSQLLANQVSRDTAIRREDVVNNLRATIEANDSLIGGNLPSLSAFPKPPASKTSKASKTSDSSREPQSQISVQPNTTPKINTNTSHAIPTRSAFPAPPVSRSTVSAPSNIQYSSSLIPEAKPTPPPTPNPAKIAAMQQLSQNTDFTIATIAKEANRIQQSDGEIYIALH